MSVMPSQASDFPDKGSAFGANVRSLGTAGEVVALRLAAPSNETEAADEAATQPSRGQLDAAVEKLNRGLRVADDSLSFSVHEETQRIVVKLVDNSTHEVIREFPSEDFLDLVVDLQNMAGYRLDLKT